MAPTCGRPCAFCCALQLLALGALCPVAGFGAVPKEDCAGCAAAFVEDGGPPGRPQKKVMAIAKVSLKLQLATVSQKSELASAAPHCTTPRLPLANHACNGRAC